MAKVIEGKVAEILDDTSVALNVGSSQGVKAGARVQIYRRVIVRDPDTSEPLGGVEVKTVRMRVVEVREKLCIARVYDRTEPFEYARLIPSLAGSSQKKITTRDGEVDSRTVRVDRGDRAVVVLAADEQGAPEARD